ncbi:DUF4236 domain-containing protein [Luteimonas sp. SJ-92]|uniref:DUF4236 domain-containing protein n=1 Tax=Luteimonas salinisoli TaxID=2752307 RepID=A0A853JA45_9GAMM|nr:DUF4236 domain-containing protein [Luteimonas salinisoli]NZA25500.1 DUF4236 domain-containing protein [Luteimonas salinisoli]
MRFRRRVTIAPGLRLNVSGSGLSLSAGPRGASVTFGKGGVWGNAGLPGTGLHERFKLSGSGPSARGDRRVPSQRAIEAALLEEFLSCRPCLKVPLQGGPIAMEDGAGNRISPEMEAVAWKHLRASLIDQVEARCASVREGIAALATLHHATPAPKPPLAHRPAPFAEPEPPLPTPLPYHWLWKWIPWYRARIDRENEAARQMHSEQMDAWIAQRDAHARANAEAALRFAARDEGGDEGLEAFLEWHLATLAWPQDTSVDLCVEEDGRRILLDVDLPEIEDLPAGTPELRSRTREVRIKPFSDAAKRRLYAAHVHAVIFRLIGEAFHVCPAAKTVVASGYSQRQDRATGVVRDEYLLSVTATREAWGEIDFKNIDALDPAVALERFELRRKVSKSGVFSAVEAGQ